MGVENTYQISSQFIIHVLPFALLYQQLVWQDLFVCLMQSFGGYFNLGYEMSTRHCGSGLLSHLQILLYSFHNLAILIHCEHQDDNQRQMILSV